MKWIIFSLIASLMICSEVTGQTNQTKNDSRRIRIAIIDTLTFSDKEVGIKALVEGNFVVYGADTRLTFEQPVLEKQITDLENEIQSLRCQNRSVVDSAKELKRLREELASRELTDKELEKGREENVLVPIRKQIREKIQEFARQQGYVIVIDQSSLAYTSVPSDVVDITADFIEFFNDWHKTQREKLNEKQN